MASRVFARILLLAYGFFSAAQGTPTQSTRALLVNVLDLHGRAVRDLTKDSFQIKVNGRRATMLDATYSLAPRRIVVLLDMSASMAGEPDHTKWRIASEAVQDLLTEAPPDVSIALLTFSDQVHDVFDFSQSRDFDDNLAERRRPVNTATPGFAGERRFSMLCSRLRKSSVRRVPGDAIYAITDGGDNSSHIPASGNPQVAARVRNTIVRILVLRTIALSRNAGRD